MPARDPLAVTPPPGELADRLHAFGELGLVFLRARLHVVEEHDRHLLDIFATAAARVLEGKPFGEWPEEAFYEPA